MVAVNGAVDSPRATTSSAVHARSTAAWLTRLELPLLVVAAVLLVASIFLPYWNIKLYAPQYPRGLEVQAYVNRLTGDVAEVDILNHYIGMMPLGMAAPIERTISTAAIPIIALLAVASFWLRGIWRFLARIPIVIYPVVFFVDLFVWLYYAGHSLNPQAPLSSSIAEFTPRILGAGKIGQFGTEATFAAGFYLSLVAALIVLVVMIATRMRRRATR